MSIADSTPCPQGNRKSNWFPIRDHLACFPQLKQLRIVDVDATGTDYFLDVYRDYLLSTIKTKTNALFDVAYLSCSAIISTS